MTEWSFVLFSKRKTEFRFAKLLFERWELLRMDVLRWSLVFLICGGVLFVTNVEHVYNCCIFRR